MQIETKVTLSPQKRKLQPPLQIAPSPSKIIYKRWQSQRMSRMQAAKLQKKLQEAYGRILAERKAL